MASDRHLELKSVSHFLLSISKDCRNFATIWRLGIWDD